MLLNISEAKIDDTAYEQATKEDNKMKEEMFAKEARAQVQQALMHELGKSAAQVTVPAYVAETGGKQEDSVSVFSQHFRACRTDDRCQPTMVQGLRI